SARPPSRPPGGRPVHPLGAAALAPARVDVAPPARLPGPLAQLAPGLGRHLALLPDTRDGVPLAARLAVPWPRALGAAPHRYRKRNAARCARAPWIATGRDAVLPGGL